MKKLVTILTAVLLVNTVIGQESTGPITRMNLGEAKSPALKSTSPVDSTFHYISDTLGLPFFDDFSLSRFQQYNANITDPNVTEELFYKLTDLSDNPLPVNTVLTSEITYRKTVDFATSETDTTHFVPVQIKKANFAQFPVIYTTTYAYPPYIIIDTIGFVNDPDTIWVNTPDLLQDSARIFHVAINDPNALWLDSYAYHNYTFAVNPWSLGVVTFDGLDETGYPYAFGSTTSGVADFLTSKPLDLSGFAAIDSLYMSFLAQPEGFGDVPETNDSLVLEFFDPALMQWNRVWSMRGGPNAEFRVVHLPVKQNIYLVDGFQFRFKNYGGLSGSLDHFHIDYVYLREASGYQDSIYEDFAWSYPVGSLIKDYTSVPWDHWKNNFAGKMNDATHVVVRNTNPVDKNPAVSTVTVRHAGAVEGSFTMADPIITGNSGNENYLAMTTVSSYHNFSTGYHFDETLPGDEVTFDIKGIATIQEPTFNQNDTCYAQQVFSDYYAYDDGSAEKAYGVTGVQARMAYKFTAYEADSLLAVRMCFVPSVNDVHNKLFLLTVWADNNGVPGSVLYTDEFTNTRTPVYEDGIGQFTTYYLKDTMRLAVPQTFYVGWRQIDADRLNIGLDMNNPNADKIFYSLNGGLTWTNSTYEGSMLMRPVFSTELNFDLAVDAVEAALPWQVYPNPTTGNLSIEWRNEAEFPGAVCRDAQGRTVSMLEKGSQQLQMDLTNVPAGIYFVELTGAVRQVKKVVRY